MMSDTPISDEVAARAPAAAERAGWSTETTCGAFLRLAALAGPGSRAHVLGVLRYQRADPFAVRLECHVPGRAPVVWRFARETLEAGVRGRAGVGSVMVCNALEGARGRAGAKNTDVFIVLRSAGKHGVLRGPGDEIGDFLARSRRLVAYGEEHRYAELDELVARLTARPGGRGAGGAAEAR